MAKYLNKTKMCQMLWKNVKEVSNKCQRKLEIRPKYNRNRSWEQLGRIVEKCQTNIKNSFKTISKYERA